MRCPRTRLTARFGLLGLLLALLLGGTTPALAGGLYRLDMTWSDAAPAAYPVTITVKVYKDAGTLKGQASGTFDGVALSGVTGDAVAELVGASVDGDSLVVDVVAHGWKGHGEMSASSSFELELAGCASVRLWDFRTSCSQPVYTDFPYLITPGGTLTWTDGCGGCLSEPPSGDCPPDNKLYRLDGELVVPMSCPLPADLAGNVYEGDATLRGPATAVFDGAGASAIACDAVACIAAANLNGGMLVVSFRAFGWKASGEFAKDTSFELVIAGCLVGNPTAVAPVTWGSLKTTYR